MMHNSVIVVFTLLFYATSLSQLLAQTRPTQPKDIRVTAYDQTLTVAANNSIPITLTGSRTNVFYITSTPFYPSGGPSSGYFKSGDVDSTTRRVLRNPITYIPYKNYASPSDKFTFIASDGTLDSGNATVSITITPINRAPVARNVTDLAFAVKPGDVSTTKPFKFRAFNSDGDPITYEASGLPSAATLNNLTGELLLKVSGEDVGKKYSNIVLTISDGKTSISNTITISVREPKTYYVAKNGLDSNPGTAEMPWLTIGMSTNYTLPGDTVVVGVGTYNERLVTKTAPNGPDYTTYQANGAVEMGGFDLRIDNLAVQGFRIARSTNLAGILIRGHNASITSNYIFGVSGSSAGISGSYSDLPEDAIVASNRVYQCQSGIWLYGKSWIVERNEIERPYNWSAAYDSDYCRFWGEKHIIRYNYFHGATTNDIGKAHIDAFQTFEDINAGTYARNILIEHNLCTDFHQGFMGEGYLVRKTENISFRNNVFANGISSTGYRAGISGAIVVDIPNVEIKNNTFYGITYGVMWSTNRYMAGTNGVFMNNICYNTGFGYSMPAPQGGTGNYNLVYQGSGYSVGPNDVYGVDPLFVDSANPLGPDGIPWTNDDGFRLQLTSDARTVGEGKVEVGAFGDSP